MRLSLGLALFSLIMPLLAGRGPVSSTVKRPSASIIVDDFQSYEYGEALTRWKFLVSKTKKYEPLDRFMSENEKFYIEQEGSNKFLRSYTRGEALRTSIPNDEALNWEFGTHPVLSWKWRALQLPEGASESGRNDTGAAVYVVFRTDWLGRPQSIKYTYSSTLPVGTVVSFGNLKVIVASTGQNEIGDWVTVRRNVADDYRKLFRKRLPKRPLLITLWSDSDDTDSTAEVDYDDLVIESIE